jgi:hypothetical protein
MCHEGEAGGAVWPLRHDIMEDDVMALHEVLFG